MKHTIYLLTAALLAASLSGCFTTTGKAVQGFTKSAVRAHCVQPVEARALERRTVNGNLEGVAMIGVKCAGDVVHPEVDKWLYGTL